MRAALYVSALCVADAIRADWAEGLGAFLGLFFATFIAMDIYEIHIRKPSAEKEQG